MGSGFRGSGWVRVIDDIWSILSSGVLYLESLLSLGEHCQCEEAYVATFEG